MREACREAEALWRYGLIRDLLEPGLSPRERGELARGLAAGGRFGRSGVTSVG